VTEQRNVIIHGDSRDYIPRISTPINAVVTDPPFGIDVKMNSASDPAQRAINERIKNDGDVAEAIDLFDSVMRQIIPKLADQAEVYVFTAWSVLDFWIPAVKGLSPHLELKMMLIWDKGYPGKGDLVANWGCGYEPILYLKKGRRPLPYRRSGIIHVDKLGAGQNIHPTEKPVQLLEKLIEMSTDPGDLVVDPFSGSGSTSVAAQKLQRNSLAFEIDNEPPRSFVDKSQARLTEQSIFS
jgi:site-specific DNA-methyltransferase (adenine-specific)